MFVIVGERHRRTDTAKRRRGMYRVQHKNNPLRKVEFLENDQAYYAIFSSVNVKVYISVRYINFIIILLSINKTMAVRSAKCHFVSEQQLISSITRK